jgi:aerobic-type carbon monoxide dehydrogenase small subunit (CoxS/CutS family)
MTAVRKIKVTVNGVSHEHDVEPRLLLSDFLRTTLGLTGTHVGCEHGVCGACTVMVDGDSARACLMFAVQADGRDIVTVEGLGTPERPHPLQRAFLAEQASQCGYCLSGILISAAALLHKNPAPDRTAIIGSSAAGSACDRLPPRVPRLRIARWAT